MKRQFHKYTWGEPHSLVSDSQWLDLPIPPSRIFFSSSFVAVRALIQAEWVFVEFLAAIKKMALVSFLHAPCWNCSSHTATSIVDFPTHETCPDKRMSASGWKKFYKMFSYHCCALFLFKMSVSDYKKKIEPWSTYRRNYRCEIDLIHKDSDNVIGGENIFLLGIFNMLKS